MKIYHLILYYVHVYPYVFQLFRCLKESYPKFPNVTDFTHTLLLSVSTQAYNPQNELYILTQFALEYKRLCIVGQLLTDLIEFYQWIHLDLIRHRVKRSYAETHTLESVVRKIDERDPNKEIYQLYERVCGRFHNSTYLMTIIICNVFHVHMQLIC